MLETLPGYLSGLVHGRVKFREMEDSVLKVGWETKRVQQVAGVLKLIARWQGLNIHAGLL
jgi:hypothetical protein